MTIKITSVRISGVLMYVFLHGGRRTLTVWITAWVSKPGMARSFRLYAFAKSVGRLGELNRLNACTTRKGKVVSHPSFDFTLAFALPSVRVTTNVRCLTSQKSENLVEKC
jgi:hypothetical protein